MRKYINSLNGYVVLAFMLASVALFADSAYRNTIKGTGARQNTIEWDFTETSTGGAMHLLPGTDNTNNIGSSSKRVKDFQAVTATFGGAVAVTGTITASSMTVVTDKIVANGSIVVPTVTIATSTPTVLGGLYKDSSYVLYIATGITTSGAYTKIGAQ